MNIAHKSAREKGPISQIAIGDLVTPNLEHSWVYNGTEKEAAMSAARTGTVIELDWASARNGTGLVRVRWNSLTDTPLLEHRAVMWIHTDQMLFAEGGDA